MQQKRDLQCPYCGYVVVNDTGVGAKYCGPHVNSRGEYSRAVQMRTIRDWDEFEKENMGEFKCHIKIPHPQDDQS